MESQPISSPKHQQKMVSGDADNHSTQIHSQDEISDHSFHELPAQHQSMDTDYRQQSQMSPLTIPQEKYIPLLPPISPSAGMTHFTPSRAPLFDQSGTSDLAKYLVRKEMVSSGLLKFDNRPENYWAWKASFCNSTSDLNLTPWGGVRFTDQMAWTAVC